MTQEHYQEMIAHMTSRIFALNVNDYNKEYDKLPPKCIEKAKMLARLSGIEEPEPKAQNDGCDLCKQGISHNLL